MSATWLKPFEHVRSGLEEMSAVFLSGGTTYIPAVRHALVERFGVPVKTGVPPEHAVCLGAAIHAAQIQFQAQTTLDALR